MFQRTLVAAGVLTVLSIMAVARGAQAAETYAADAVHSSIVYRVKHMDTSYFWGRFNDFSGTFTLDKENPAQGKLDFQVKTDSIDTANAKRDQHLKSPDFFNAVQFPVISFKSSSITKSGAAYEVVGDLTLHGVTRPVSVKVVPTGSGTNQMGKPIAGIDASFTIKRSDFGMNKMVGPVGDEVWVNVCIEGSQK